MLMITRKLRQKKKTLCYNKHLSIHNFQGEKVAEEKKLLCEKSELEEKENEEDYIFDAAEHAEFSAWVNANLN